ncbi:MAG: NUDIX hydrolase [Patescibacteria group bacterium]|nr:NUDIX hydrolase [Patescibacteria group bacterium]
MGEKKQVTKKRPEKFVVGIKGFIVKDNKLLLLKKSERGYISSEFWDLPGGRIDGDENPLETLKRELNEELPGIKEIEIKDLLWVYRIPYVIENASNLFLVYYLVGADVSAAKLSTEHVEKKWVGIDEFGELDAPVNANFKDLLREFIGKKI